jgi:flagellar biogenesis protein FliO
MITAGNSGTSVLNAGYPPTQQGTGTPAIESTFSIQVRHLLAKLVTQAKKIQVRQNKKRLRVCETLSLGDKRFVAVIQVDEKQFLLGGSHASVSLLAQLEKPAEFATVLNARIAEVKSQ